VQVGREEGVPDAQPGHAVYAPILDADAAPLPAYGGYFRIWLRGAFLAVPGVGVVRGDDAGFARREPVLLGVPPDHLPPVGPDRVLLDPTFAWSFDQAALDAEAAADGGYALLTNLPTGASYCLPVDAVRVAGGAVFTGFELGRPTPQRLR